MINILAKKNGCITHSNVITTALFKISVLIAIKANNNKVIDSGNLKLNKPNLFESKNPTSFI